VLLGVAVMIVSYQYGREITMTTRTILAAAAVVVVAAVMATTALAASTLKDPKTLVLQKSDFPAGARLIKKYTAGGATSGGATYYVTYRYKAGSKTRQLSSSAIVFKSRGAAVAGFRYFKSDTIKTATKLTLPKYGDEQFATFLGLDGGELFVRKNTVVWSLKIDYDLDIGLTKPEAIAELKRYAPKQMKRVGSG
jgi:hypothetical protein